MSRFGTADPLRRAWRGAGWPQKYSMVLTFLIVISVAALSGCAPQAAPQAAPQGTPQATSQAASKETLSLKVGLLPIIDVLPMYVAEQEGYFKQQNLQVELVLFPSALERDSAFVAGQIDGELNDPVSAGLLNKDGEKAKVVRLTYKGNPSMAMMVLVAAPNSKIASAKDLKGVPIGISKNSIIEYATDRMLQSAGLAASDIEKTEVTKIPVRAEMLAKGQIQAGTLPEPLASLAEQQGAHRVVDDSKSGIGQSVMTFRQDVVAKNPEAIRRFLAAYEQGVTAINASPNKYRDLMVDKAKVADSLKSTFNVPQFVKGQLPAQGDIEDVVRWMVEQKLLDKAIPYDKLVAPGLLPK